MTESTRAARERISTEFAELCAAQRMFEDLVDDGTRLRIFSTAETARDALARLNETNGNTDNIAAMELALVAAKQAISSFQSGLLASLSQIPVTQLRAALPEIVRDHRRECLALLDLLLSSDDRIGERIRTVEYLITLLSTDGDTGHRRVTTDPVQLTAQLAEISTAVQARTKIDTDDIAFEFLRAFAEISEAPEPLTIVRQLHNRKIDMRTGILAPDVLRAIVSYNVKVANLVNRRFGGAGHEDLDLLLANRPPPMAESSELQGKTESSTAEDFTAASMTPGFDTAPGVVQVRNALQRRLRQVLVCADDPDSVAHSFDLSLLSSTEIDAVLCDEPDGFQRLVSNIVLIGFLVKALPACEARLRAIGLPRGSLRNDWLGEVDDEAQAFIESETHVGRVERSRVIADLKARFLSDSLGSLSAISRESADLDAPDFDEASRQDEPETAAVGVSTLANLQDRFLFAPPSGKKSRQAPVDTEARNEPPRYGHDRESETPAAENTPPLSHSSTTTSPPSLGRRPANNQTMIIHDAPPRRRILPWVASAALIFFGLNFAIGHKPAELRELSETQLAASSSFLVSAYRDGKGSGRLVIGRISADYLRLPIERQIAVAGEVARSFTSEGAAEVMIYDPSRKLVIHYADGKLRSPTPGKAVGGSSA